MRLLPLLAMLLLPLTCAAAAAADDASAPGMDGTVSSKDGRFLLGVGYGVVRFDVNAKITDRDSGFSRYVDLEGNLGLDKRSNVRAFYGSYLINDKHSIVFNYFGINRKSTLLDFDGSYEDWSSTMPGSRFSTNRSSTTSATVTICSAVRPTA